MGFQELIVGKWIVLLNSGIKFYSLNYFTCGRWASFVHGGYLHNVCARPSNRASFVASLLQQMMQRGPYYTVFKFMPSLIGNCFVCLHLIFFVCVYMYLCGASVCKYVHSCVDVQMHSYASVQLAECVYFKINLTVRNSIRSCCWSHPEKINQQSRGAFTQQHRQREVGDMLANLPYFRSSHLCGHGTINGESRQMTKLTKKWKKSKQIHVK